MAVAIALPILANGVRAWGTIYVAQSQGLEFAAGFDHIFYGWVFFAIVMAALLAMSWPYFDREPEDVPAAADWPALDRLEGKPASPRAVLTVLAGIALATSLWAGASRALAAELPARIELPSVAGWQRVDYRPPVWWEPRASGSDHRLLGRYRDGAGREVDVFLALYSGHHASGEPGAAGEGALVPDTSWRWLRPGPSIDGGKGEWLRAPGARRYAVTWFHSGELLTADRKSLKLKAMTDRLAMRAEPVTMLILSAEDGREHDAAGAIAAFADATGPLGPWMDGVAQVP